MLFKIVSTAPIISICKTYISSEYLPNQDKRPFNVLYPRKYMVNHPAVLVRHVILIPHNQCAASIKTIHVWVQAFYLTTFLPYLLYLFFCI